VKLKQHSSSNLHLYYGCTGQQCWYIVAGEKQPTRTDYKGR